MSYLKAAMKVFGQIPDMVRYVPKQNFKNCIVSFRKVSPNRIEKIVTRKDGTEIVGHFWHAPGQKQPYLGRVTLNTERGRIAYNYGAENYDKVVQLDSYAGDSLTRLGHKNRPNCFTDTYLDRNQGFYRSGDYSDEYNRLYNYIKEG